MNLDPNHPHPGFHPLLPFASLPPAPLKPRPSNSYQQAPSKLLV